MAQNYPQNISAFRITSGALSSERVCGCRAIGVNITLLIYRDSSSRQRYVFSIQRLNSTEVGRNGMPELFVDDVISGLTELTEANGSSLYVILRSCF